MTSLRKFLISSALTGAFVVSGCGSTTKSSTDSESTTTSSTTTTVSGDATSTSAAATTTPATAAPVVAATTTPATTPATTPQIITSFSVGNASACPSNDVPYTGPLPSVSISWTVTSAADGVQLLLDGGLYGNYGLSGSDSLPASCDSNGHNQHTYSVVAMKNGQQIAKNSATRGS